MIWEHNVSAIALSIGPLEIRWYGLVYALGFFFVRWYITRTQPSSTHERWDSRLFGAFICGVIGGRVGEFLFYSFPILLTDPLEIFRIWNGGMSIHGGVLGAFIFMLIYEWKNTEQNFRENFKATLHQLLKISDIIVTPLFLVLTFGRLANFANAELIGLPTEGENWGVMYNFVEGVRHPTQIYESLKNLLIFIVLLQLRKSQYNHILGLPTWIGLISYSILRLWIEGYKESTTLIWGTSVSVIFCWIGICIGALGILRTYRKNHHP